jgi:hypothetical protein
MEIKKKLVSPEMAKNWLESFNLDNRNVNQQRVASYVNDIVNGNWREDTGECIKFSKTNRLLDGQHRLLAIVKSGISLNLHIATGLEDSIFNVLDTGKPRGGLDAMKIAGVSAYAQVSSIIQKYNMLAKGSYKNDKRNALSNSDLLNIYNSKPKYWDEKANYAKRQKGKFNNIMSSTIIGGFSSVFDEKNIETSELFFDELCSGRNVTNQTINVLRDRLIKDKVSKVNKLSKKFETIFIIKTWNAYRLGKEFKILKFDESLESFPTII